MRLIPPLASSTRVLILKRLRLTARASGSGTHAEVQLVAFLRLLHPGAALVLCMLGGVWRVDQSGIDVCAGR